MVRTLSKKVLTRTLLDFNLTIKFYVYKMVPELGFESSSLYLFDSRRFLNLSDLQMMTLE